MIDSVKEQQSKK